MVSLQQLEKFMRLLHAVQNVERVARIPDETKLRNTAEHTFELAMVCWYLNSANELGLDTEKILTYALAHDLIEAYTGDVYAYDEAARDTKEQGEKLARERLATDHAEFPELLSAIDNYERRTDAESRFVYACDKLIDPLNASMETQQSLMKEYDLSYQTMRDYKDSKIAQSEYVAPYWKAVCEKYEKHKDFFFNA